METLVVRLWLPDRPGALGAVASRIGAVRGDVVGVEILERGGGRAIDELVVELPDASLVSLLVAEIGQVDGVDVEDVRIAPARVPDASVEALDTAARLVAVSTTGGLFDAMTAHACAAYAAEWAAAVELDAGVLVASEGAPPPPAWLAAFVAGMRSSGTGGTGSCGAEDVAWALLEEASTALVMGRQGRPFRSRERLQLDALCRIAALRWIELERAPSSLRLSV